MTRVTIYSEGPLCLSACAPADMSVQEVTAEVNQLSMCGTALGWVPSPDPTFRQGAPNPGPCEQDPSRRHYLFNA